MKRPEELFAKLKFRKSQLDAIIEIYNKYFLPKINQPYQGKAFVFIWDQKTKWETSSGFDINHSNPGYSVHECTEDPLWQEFSDLLPFMSTAASITKMPPGDVMYPHVDRKWRPEAIYFPISGCSELCISDYYYLPKIHTDNSQSLPPDIMRMVVKNLKPISSYSVYDNAYLTNVHEWHGVRNLSDMERTAFGWNFKNPNLSFKECKLILKDLGYL